MKTWLLLLQLFLATPLSASLDKLQRLKNVPRLLSEHFPGALVEPTGTRGAFSLVYRIDLPSTDGSYTSTYIAKVSKEMGDQRTFDGYRREAEFLKLISGDPEISRFIAKPYGIIELKLSDENTEPVLVMSYANQKDLESHLQKFSQMPLKTLLGHWTELAGVLRKLKERYGIVHGDLKTRNILLNKTSEGQFQIWIGDWTDVYRIEERPTTLGTPAYLHQKSFGDDGRWPELDNIRALQLMLLELASGMRLTDIMDLSASCTIAVSLPHLKYPDVKRYLTQIPGGLRKELPPVVLRLIESNFSTLQDLHNAAMSALDTLP